MFLLLLAAEFGKINAYLNAKSKLNSVRVRSRLFNVEGNDEIMYKEFSGPKSTLDEMVAGIENDELGINVVVGPSEVAGLGLFVCVSEDVDEVKLASGTPIVGYSKGEFGTDANGDKTVSFVVESPRQAVFFEKKLMPVVSVRRVIDLYASRELSGCICRSYGAMNTV